MQSTWLGRRSALIFFLLTLAVPVLANADPITLAWDPNPTTVTGYRVYVSTAVNGSLTGTPVADVGTATTYTYPSAIPGQAYYFSVTAYITDSSGTVESPHSIEVSGYSNAPPVMARPSDVTSTVGQAVSLQLSGSDPYGSAVSYLANGLPPGLSLSSSTGLITGTPTTAGNYTVTVSVTDGVLSATPLTFNWTIQAAPAGADTIPPVITITSPTTSGSITTSSSTVTIGGSVTDNVGVSLLTWQLGSGAATAVSGTAASWSTGPIALQPGVNTITLRARDAASNFATVTFTATYTQVTGSQPSIWTSADVGNPAIAGTTTVNDGTISLRAGGNDIWDGADQFRFAYQQLAGDFDISGRVASVQVTNAWSKAGFMIRDSLQAGAINSALMVSASNGLVFQNRATTNGSSISVKQPGSAPVWLKLTRRGNLLTGYMSANGTAWTPYGTQTLSLSQTVFVGMAVTSHDVSAASTAVFDTVTLTGSETVNPTIAIASPTASATYSTTSATVALAGTASDNVGVTQVSWSNNRGGSGTATGTTSWSVASVALQTGANILTVTARDAAGNTASATLTVTYAQEAVPPTIAIVTPTSSATYNTAIAAVALAGTANDNVGVTQVTWSNNRGGSGTATGTANWSVASVALQTGANILTVTARDAAGNTGTATLTVTYAQETVPPTISIGSPTASPTYSTVLDTVTVSGAASDNVGVTQVSWSNNRGGAGIATGTTNWSTGAVALQAGANVITVTARDAAGNTASIVLSVTSTPPVAVTISADSVAPTSGSGLTQSFTFRSSDSRGATSLATTRAMFGTSTSATLNTCSVTFNHATRTLSLLNDFGTASTTATVGASGVLENGQCAIALGTSTQTASGTTSTLTLALTFKANFVGAKNVYLYAGSTDGQNSGWQQRGTWTVPAPATPVITAGAVTPDTGAGTTQAFTFQYGDTRGATNLVNAWVWVNSSLSASSANSCLMFFDRALGGWRLLSDSGATWSNAVPLGGGTLENRQCSISMANASASINGTTLTLNLAITFKPAYAGAKSIFTFASAAGDYNSGWQTRGAWTVR